MPSSPSQPDPKEAVEAQLCAYLEGDLSPDERTAIEQHLSGNPPHRQLLADLALTRQWLRDLPREPAPADVGEAFQQQVERSLLLGDEYEPKARKNGGRLPQVALMAALILVTAGLGVGLMLMLSGPNRPTPKFAANVPASRPADTASDSPVAARDAAATPPSAPVAAARSPEPSITEAATPPQAAGGAGGGGFRGRLLNTAAPDAVAAVTPSPTIHMRVVTADPVAVDGVLVNNGLTLVGTTGAPLASRRGMPGTQYVTEQQFATQEAQHQSQMAEAQSNSGGASPSLMTGPRRYIARGLTADQTRRLRADLTAAAGPGRVTVVGGTPSTAPDTATPIAPGELITVVIPQLTGPGVGQTNTVRVAPDGTIALPMLDAVPAAGATKDALAHRVADRYRQANLIANPSVTVVTTVTPTTQATGALQAVTVEVESLPAEKK